LTSQFLEREPFATLEHQDRSVIPQEQAGKRSDVTNVAARTRAQIEDQPVQESPSYNHGLHSAEPLVARLKRDRWSYRYEDTVDKFGYSNKLWLNAFSPQDKGPAAVRSVSTLELDLNFRSWQTVEKRGKHLSATSGS